MRDNDTAFLYKSPPIGANLPNLQPQNTDFMLEHLSAYRLSGYVQHYAWGGSAYLPQLLGIPNPDGQPFAEYWMGVHPKGPATVALPDGTTPLLADFLAAHPGLLEQSIWDTYGGLPFLFKVLDVEAMLSIQLHPQRDAARAGFDRETAAGIPLDADHRNYKDANHKPEVMVALTDFWLLHGFQSPEAIRRTLLQYPAWASLLPLLDNEGVRGLYAHVMLLPPAEVDALLQPVHDDLAARQDTLTPDTADYWAWQAFAQYSRDGHHDRGVFSVYWFNLVFLRPGQGIFQGAGIPHAYLRGVNVELMANSDNVLRGGLTPKHIDVPELLANIVTTPVVPAVLSPDGATTDYPVPVPDFGITRHVLDASDTRQFTNPPSQLALVIAGQVLLGGQLLAQGECAFCPAGIDFSIVAMGGAGAEVFLAYCKEE
jgi:mannose-6-phosphate isomerase